MSSYRALSLQSAAATQIDDTEMLLVGTGVRSVSVSLTVLSGVADGGSAVAVVLDTANALSTSGAKLLSVRNAGAEKFAIDKDGSLILADGANLVGNVTTGNKVGTAASEKWAFFGASPVVQPTYVARPSGGSTQDTESRTVLDEILDRLEALGLFASS